MAKAQQKSTPKKTTKPSLWPNVQIRETAVQLAAKFARRGQPVSAARLSMGMGLPVDNRLSDEQAKAALDEARERSPGFDQYEVAEKAVWPE